MFGRVCGPGWVEAVGNLESYGILENLENQIVHGKSYLSDSAFRGEGGWGGGTALPAWHLLRPYLCVHERKKLLYTNFEDVLRCLRWFETVFRFPFHLNFMKGLLVCSCCCKRLLLLVDSRCYINLLTYQLLYSHWHFGCHGNLTGPQKHPIYNSERFEPRWVNVVVWVIVRVCTLINTWLPPTISQEQLQWRIYWHQLLQTKQTKWRLWTTRDKRPLLQSIRHFADENTDWLWTIRDCRQVSGI